MAKRNIAYRYRVYPTEEQKTMFSKTFGCCRKVWNLMLEDKQLFYDQAGRNLTITPAAYKDIYPFLNEVDSMALCNVQLDLQAAYSSFYKGVSGFPKYKSRKNTKGSFTTNCRKSGKNETIYFSDSEKYISLPKIPSIRVEVHRKAPADYKLKSVTVSKERSGKYYISVLYEYDAEIQPVEPKTHIGLDYASAGLFVSSDGYCPEMPKYYLAAQKRLAVEQRKLSKMKGSKKGETKSNNYKKQELKIAKIHEHIANQRKDFLHKHSAAITKQYDVICIEDLDLEKIASSDDPKKLGKATYNNGWNMFVSMLIYKQERLGHYVIKVGKYYPSSQLCQCGYKNPITKDLSVRIMTCPICGKTYNRDINAAMNIDKEGLRLLKENSSSAIGIS